MITFKEITAVLFWIYSHLSLLISVELDGVALYRISVQGEFLCTFHRMKRHALKIATLQPGDLLFKSSSQMVRFHGRVSSIVPVQWCHFLCGSSAAVPLPVWFWKCWEKTSFPPVCKTALKVREINREKIWSSFLALSFSVPLKRSLMGRLDLHIKTIPAWTVINPLPWVMFRNEQAYYLLLYFPLFKWSSGNEHDSTRK